MENAREITAQLVQDGAARQVSDQRDFKNTAEEILSDGVLRDRIGQAGRDLIDKNKGALELTLRAVERVLEEKPAVAQE